MTTQAFRPKQTSPSALSHSKKENRKPRIGAHLPIKDGLHEALLLGAELGCDAIQIFSRNPRGWMAKPLTPDSIELFKKTLGIVGLGNIGRKLAEKASGLGLKIVATSRSGRNAMDGVRLVELDELLSVSDYVSLHLPLVPATKHLIGAAQLARMKPSAYLNNTARGGLIDNAALAAALPSGKLAGAALDVQDPEPPDLSQPLYTDPRVVVTPHAAFVSEESLANLRERVSRQVAARLTGGVPENVVNGIV
jgi:D-3-phosphoglycerate dehydrogenase